MKNLRSLPLPKVSEGASVHSTEPPWPEVLQRGSASYTAVAYIFSSPSMSYYVEPIDVADFVDLRIL